MIDSNELKLSESKENIVEREKNTGNQKLAFPTMFSNFFTVRVRKTQKCLVKGSPPLIHIFFQTTFENIVAKVEL